MSFPGARAHRVSCRATPGMQMAHNVTRREGEEEGEVAGEGAGRAWGRDRGQGGGRWGRTGGEESGQPEVTVGRREIEWIEGRWDL